MEIAVRYREYAASCVRLAQESHNQAARVTLLDMAQVWIALADQAERSARTAEITAELAFNAQGAAQGTGKSNPSPPNK